MEKLSNLSKREKMNRVRINNKVSEVEIAFKLPKNITEKVFQLYLEAKRANLLRGKNWETIFAACLGVAVKEQKMPLTIGEITNKLNVSFRKTERLMKLIAQKLSIKILSIDISSFIDRFCADLDLSDKVRTKAKEILKKAVKAGLTNGPSPQGIAAAIVYIAAILGGEHRTQNEMSKIIGVTEVTIRTRYKEIAKKLDIDMLL